MTYLFDLKCICYALEVQVLDRIILGTVMTCEECPNLSPMAMSCLEHKLVRNRWMMGVRSRGRASKAKKILTVVLEDQAG